MLHLQGVLYISLNFHRPTKLQNILDTPAYIYNLKKKITITENPRNKYKKSANIYLQRIRDLQRRGQRYRLRGLWSLRPQDIQASQVQKLCPCSKKVGCLSCCSSFEKARIRLFERTDTYSAHEHWIRIQNYSNIYNTFTI